MVDAHAKASRAPNNHRVLVIDHSPTIRSLLAEQLKSLRVQVDTASTAEEAIQHLETQTVPTIIVMDCELPDMDGITLCRWIRSRSGLTGCYIIALSGVEGDNRLAYVGKEADDFVRKPYEERMLLASVRTGLRAYARRQFFLRKARREAIAWLARVVAHEVNNPLASACANLSFLQDAMTGGGEIDDGLVDAVQDISNALDRIGDVAQRLQTTTPDFETEPCHVTMRQFMDELRGSLDGMDVTWSLGRCSGNEDQNVRLERELLAHAIGELTRVASVQCEGKLEVGIHFEDCRVAVLLDFEGAPTDSPENLLEACLSNKPGESPRFDPGLSWLEGQFVDRGGQVFTGAQGGRWRFGLVLPIEEVGAQTTAEVA